MSKPFPSPVHAAAQWLLVLPATILLGAAALRMLLPPQHQPARTISLLTEWTGSHLSRWGAGILFLALPAAAAVAGCLALLAAWRTDRQLRNDVISAFSILRRREAVAALATATVLAGAILLFVLAHMITD